MSYIHIPGVQIANINLGSFAIDSRGKVAAEVGFEVAVSRSLVYFLVEGYVKLNGIKVLPQQPVYPRTHACMCVSTHSSARTKEGRQVRKLKSAFTHL
jgi:hypothetical protein